MSLHCERASKCRFSCNGRVSIPGDAALSCSAEGAGNRRDSDEEVEFLDGGSLLDVLEGTNGLREGCFERGLCVSAEFGARSGRRNEDDTTEGLGQLGDERADVSRRNSVEGHGVDREIRHGLEEGEKAARNWRCALGKFVPSRRRSDHDGLGSFLLDCQKPDVRSNN